MRARHEVAGVLQKHWPTVEVHPQINAWQQAKTQGKFLFPVKGMSLVFRAKYVQRLKEHLPEVDRQLVNALFRKKWVVYAKRAFAGPQSVVEYLGRYTHKIAIANHRLTQVDEQTVSFTYKDYHKGGSSQLMTLPALEFIRRFALHILPRGFVRIRHYGILSGTSKSETIPLIRQQLLARADRSRCGNSRSIIRPYAPVAKKKPWSCGRCCLKEDRYQA